MTSKEKRGPTVTITTRPRRPSTESSTTSLKTPRIARFAEATAVYSPIEPSQQSRLPLPNLPMDDPKPQLQPSDIGFGYLANNRASTHLTPPGQEAGVEETDRRHLPPPTPASPLKSPLKSALKSPGAAPRKFDNPLSPTFQEEQILEKHEEDTEKEQASDLKVKFRVRMAKIMLRGVNFSCSLIVLSMLATTFAIFNATKQLPPRNNLPPWAVGQKIWPQVTLIVIATVSLLMSIAIFYAYWRGGHRRAEKVAVYYTTFAIAFFIFSNVMWLIGAGILNQSKANGQGKDMWGWACKDNKRRTLFEEDVHYALVCRLQNWSLICCIIEVVVETITIAIYGVVFYRFWTKRKLRKSMATRDRARSDLYLAQLRSQTAPNTPGFGPLSPRDGGWRPPPGHPMSKDALSAAEEGDAREGVQYAIATPRGFAQPKPFTLQPPPIKIHAATPKAQQAGFEATAAQPTAVSEAPASPTYAPTSPVFATPERHQGHAEAAPGEQQYDAVPIPGAYASPLCSPGFAPSATGFDFGLGGGERR